MNNETVKQVSPTCPLCGGEVKICKGMKLHSSYEIIYDWIEFECLTDGCQMNIHFDNFDKGITISEALKRFSTRPETAWEMYQRLCLTYKSKFLEKLRNNLSDYGCHLLTGLLQLKEQEAIATMQQIEKELKALDKVR